MPKRGQNLAITLGFPRSLIAGWILFLITKALQFPIASRHDVLVCLGCRRVILKLGRVFVLGVGGQVALVLSLLRWWLLVLLLALVFLTKESCPETSLLFLFLVLSLIILRSLCDCRL